MVPEPEPNDVQYVKAPSEYKPCAEHTFLFVNESATSSLKPGKKLGHRKDIRSHVRKHVLTEDRRKPAVRREAAPLASLTPINQSLTLRGRLDGEGRGGIVYGNSESRERKVEIRWIEETFDTDGTSILDVSTTSLGPEDANLDHRTMEPDMHDDELAASCSSTGDYSSSDASMGSYCLHCGAHRDAWRWGNTQWQRKQPTLTVRKGVKGGTFEVSNSPLGILGAGRVDPFSCYPGNGEGMRLHELVDHSVTYLLPGLISDGSNNEERSLSRAWFSSGLKHPLLFHALAFAGSIHLDFLHHQRIFPNSRIALSHKLAVIQTLNQVLGNPKTAASRDEIILAILILASHETMDMSRAKSEPFQSPLRKVQWLNIYGNFTNVPEHMTAVMELLSLRGGVESLELYGLAEIIVGGDVVSATRNLMKPSLLPLRLSGEWIAYLLQWATFPTRLSTQKLSSKFARYLECGVTFDMLSVFEAAGAMTMAIEHYVEGQIGGLSLSAISRTRTAVQQRILSLPSVVEIQDAGFPFVYEACRLTGIIYGIAVIFPIPNTYLVLQELVQRLKVVIDLAAMGTLGVEIKDLYLWILVIGGIASLDKLERNWYIGRLSEWAMMWGIRDWMAVEQILGNFLWLESACGPGGQKVWGEVIECGIRIEITE